MTLDEAKEILNDILVDGTEPDYPLMDNAIKLGIEALKEFSALRVVLKSLGRSLLPGETKG